MSDIDVLIGNLIELKNNNEWSEDESIKSRHLAISCGDVMAPEWSRMLIIQKGRQNEITMHLQDPYMYKALTQGFSALSSEDDGTVTVVE